MAKVGSNNGSEEAGGEEEEEEERLRIAVEETEGSRRLIGEQGGSRRLEEGGKVTRGIETPKKLHLGFSNSLEVSFLSHTLLSSSHPHPRAMYHPLCRWSKMEIMDWRDQNKVRGNQREGGTGRSEQLGDWRAQG